MNRIIKFRGQKFDDKEWIYGSLIGTDVITEEEPDVDEDYIGIGVWSSVLPETVGQYTGLKDKNGIEIYEGDIVEFKSESAKILFQNGIYWTLFSDGLFKALTYTHINSEIISDIHTNPELLKDGEK